MKILITGGCGFVGSNLAIYFKDNQIGTQINSLDNLSRKGTLLNFQISEVSKVEWCDYNTALKHIRDYNLENRVCFYNAKDDIREIYSLSALVMNLSSTPEPFGRTLLEAAMMGKKICGWNRGGVGEV